METNNKLTPRQWKLYNWVKFCTLSGRYTDKEDICKELSEFYKAEHNNNENGSFVNCPAIYQDIKAINKSDEIEKIIVVDKNKIYLGNEEDCRKYADKLKEKAIKLLTRSYKLTHKINSDGNGKLVSCHGDIITPESQARQFVESFVNEKVVGK